MRQNWYRHMYTLLLNTEDTLVNQHYPLSASYIYVGNYTHCAFVVYLGALDSALTLQVEQDTDATETASIKDLTGATDVIAADDDDQVFVLEFATERLSDGFDYVTLDVTGVAGANDYGCVVFYGWNAKTLPVTQPGTFPSGNSVLLVG